ncbi:MAG: hypothetical protein JY451_11015 [Erythrobacter sp.]|nr:MAG: hypothetical protein JY451_11015 [Erythrobacter sp.]
MDSTASGAAPWHLWVVGVIALLFTAFGGYDYTMSQLGDRAYIEAAVGGMGIPVDAAVDYFSSFPLWLDFLWAVGVWGAVLGAVLLLLRKRMAYPIFVLSLAAFIATNVYGFANPIPGINDPTPTYIATAVVFSVMLGLTLYARAMAARGVLG